MSTGYRLQVLLLVIAAGFLFTPREAGAQEKQSLADRLSSFGKSLVGKNDNAGSGSSRSGSNNRYGRSRQNRMGGGAFSRGGSGGRDQAIDEEGFDYEKEFFAEEDQKGSRTSQIPNPQSQRPLKRPITPLAETSKPEVIRSSPATSRESELRDALSALAEEPEAEAVASESATGRGLSAFLEAGRDSLAEAEPVETVPAAPVERVAETAVPAAPPAANRAPARAASSRTPRRRTIDVGESLRNLRPAVGSETASVASVPAEPAVVEPEPRFDGVQEVFQNTERPQAPKRAPRIESSVASRPEGLRTDRRAKGFSNTGGVLLTHMQPSVTSRIEGPRKVVVGKEAGYRVVLQNQGDTPVRELSASVRIPRTAELIDTYSTSGVVKRSESGDNNSIDWRLYELEPGAEHELSLRLVPREGSTIPLAVQWSQAPTEAVATLDVMEPKLRIAIQGPSEVLYGKGERYKLVLSNPGTGPAENVVVELLPPGQEAGVTTSHAVGVIGAGETHEVELELTARDEGELTMQASVNADTGLFAETEKSVLCRRPALEIDWRGPDKKYAGTPATYYFRVRNPGSAPTETVDVSLDLPEDAEFLTASEGHRYSDASGRLSWSLPSLDVGEERFLQVRCKLSRPGLNRLRLSANAAGDLSDGAEPQTDVVALADLKLEVSDPQGPIAVGEDTVYEVRVVNRGTTSARGVNVIGLFSQGIDPTSVEGAQYSMQDGRVSLQPIDTLPAGGTLSLRIHAKADRAGTHVFRAEVVCQDLELKLATEETTRFYEDEFRWEAGETPYTAERAEEGARR
ncbi:MAG: hypothetical protein AAGA92_03085 [Planctomycetota bacterium]